MALLEVSSIFLPCLKVIFTQYVKFFLILIEGLRTEDVVHCTDCETH